MRFTHPKRSPTMRQIEEEATTFYGQRKRSDLLTHAQGAVMVALTAKMLEPDRFTGKPDEPNEMLARLLFLHSIDDRKIPQQGLSIVGKLMVPGLDTELQTFNDLRRLNELPEIDVVKYAELLRVPRIALPAMIADFGTLHDQTTFAVSAAHCKTDVFYRHHGEWETVRRYMSEKGIKIFAPFAEMCGWQELRNVILENAYRDIDPEFYRMITEALRMYATPIRNTQRFIAEVLDEFKTEAAKRGIKVKIKFRETKSIGGTLEKLDRRRDLQRDITNLHDLVAFTIITADETSAFMAHSLFTEVFNRKGGRDMFYLHVDDYITNPKPNGYRSLNVDIVSFDPKRYANAEEITRSEEMHAEAEGGAYAHQVYKGYGTLHGRQTLHTYMRLIKALSDPAAFEKLSIPATGSTVRCVIRIVKTDGTVRPVQLDMFSDDTLFDVVAMALKTFEHKEGIPLDPTKIGIVGPSFELGKSLGPMSMLNLTISLDEPKPMVSGKAATKLVKPVRTVEGALLATQLARMR